jgi:predicted DNA-binding protein
MAGKQRQQLAVVVCFADLPDFPDEEAEATFWDTHTLSPALLESMHPPTEDEAPIPAHRTRAISIRMDEGILERLQALAEVSGRRYQSLLKKFVAERIELEERKAKEAFIRLEG